MFIDCEGNITLCTIVCGFRGVNKLSMFLDLYGSRLFCLKLQHFFALEK